MAQVLKRPNGTEDVTPRDIHKWYTVEQVARNVAESYGFGEIRIPTFESTDLFCRSVGETTDVVQKEMYSVIAKETQFTLRPEGTAGTIRAMLQNSMLNDAMPQKVYYLLSCFRHERPQAGRLREFHQFGLEMVGSAAPCADAEVISLAKSVLDTLGLKNIALNINSIGCPKCRAEYHKALRTYFEARKDELCETCLSRLERNPMRILDCKSPVCSKIADGAPRMLEYLCDDCSSHFEELKKLLDASEIKYTVNPSIVRGLDYYTRTVFEFVSDEIGSQGTVCGGGRYDGLVAELGGNDTPALGFGMGLERLLMLMEKQGCPIPETPAPDLYIAPMGPAALSAAVAICRRLRSEGFAAATDLMGRSLKAQMKYAGKSGYRFTCVIGDDELAKGVVTVKDMTTGESSETEISRLSEKLTELALKSAFNEAADSAARF